MRAPAEQAGLLGARGILAATALGLAGLIPVAAAGAAPGSARPALDALALLGWLSLWALPGGAWCGLASARAASAARALAALAAPPLAWTLALWAAGARAERGLPAELGGAQACAALFACGFCAGRALAARAGLGLVALALLAALALAGLPTRFDLPGRAWPSAQSARALALSPQVFAAECAGVDWMRRPRVYAGAGTDRFQRAPARTHAAVRLGLGALALAAALELARARRARAASKGSAQQP